MPLDPSVTNIHCHFFFNSAKSLNISSLKSWLQLIKYNYKTELGNLDLQNWWMEHTGAATFWVGHIDLWCHLPDNDVKLSLKVMTSFIILMIILFVFGMDTWGRIIPESLDWRFLFIHLTSMFENLNSPDSLFSVLHVCKSS